MEFKNVGFVNIALGVVGRVARARNPPPQQQQKKQQQQQQQQQAKFWGPRTKFISEPLSDNFCIPEMEFKNVGFVNVLFWKFMFVVLLLVAAAATA